MLQLIDGRQQARQVLAPQRRNFQRAFARVAAQPALLQAVSQQHFGQLARHVVAALRPVQTAVGQSCGGGWFIHALHCKAYCTQPRYAVDCEPIAIARGT